MGGLGVYGGSVCSGCEAATGSNVEFKHEAEYGFAGDDKTAVGKRHECESEAGGDNIEPNRAFSAKWVVVVFDSVEDESWRVNAVSGSSGGTNRVRSAEDSGDGFATVDFCHHVNIISGEVGERAAVGVCCWRIPGKQNVAVFV